MLLISNLRNQPSTMHLPLHEDLTPSSSPPSVLPFPPNSEEQLLRLRAVESSSGNQYTSVIQSLLSRKRHFQKTTTANNSSSPMVSLAGYCVCNCNHQSPTFLSTDCHGCFHQMCLPFAGDYPCKANKDALPPFTMDHDVVSKKKTVVFIFVVL